MRYEGQNITLFLSTGAALALVTILSRWDTREGHIAGTHVHVDMGERTRTNVYLDDELREWAEEHEDVESLSSVTRRLLHAARREDIDISDIGTQGGTQREDTRLHERMSELEDAWDDKRDMVHEIYKTQQDLLERVQELEDMAHS